MRSSGPRKRSAPTSIRASTGLFPLGLDEALAHRSLLWAFVRRDVKTHYQQTVLGPAWLLVQPLVTTVVLAVMLTRFIELSTDGQPAPLFYLSAMIMWSFFSDTVLTISHVFVYQEYLFSKVSFPRILVPVSTLVSSLVGLALQIAMLGLLVAFLVTFKAYEPDLAGLWLLVPALAMLLALALGTGLLLASTTARYRDVANSVPFLLQTGFLATPVVYSFSSVPDKWRLPLAIVNPLSVVSDLWRGALTGAPLNTNGPELAAGAASVAVILFTGVVAFQWAQRTAADTI